MAIRTYKVTLDTKNSIAPEPVFLRQGDRTGAVVIDATLMDNGAPVSLDGLTPMFKANTADGQAVIADSTGFNVLDSANGDFTYQVPNALSAVPGKIKVAYFSFSDSSGTESTFDVAFVVKMAVDITQKQAEDYITIIDGTIKSLSDKIDSMNSDIQTILNAYNQGDFYNKSETDSRDASTLASAKSYADSGDSTTLTNAKSYADTKDGATLSSAKLYTDNLSKESSVTISDASKITGFAEGYISFSQKGNMVIACFDVRLGTMQPGYSIVATPSGFAPSSISVNGHYSFTKSGLEVKLTANSFTSQVTDAGSWWVGSCVYFTNDQFP
ncbi:BppU family phage baseplate upper protein [Lacticaseibacillus paracasei]|uniref:BppU family phage baseplate upper protein n=1 Tax=Lacticaseibacillus paracasei TaxID=1597 RepID=UPI001EDF6A6E|nr:BppU family phage baseplate upper protein [Lacticaseibacillus paracasei]MCG4283888.1 BppU family phage baseplate upper protein [Lacticaseibacillus paracasei]